MAWWTREQLILALNLYHQTPFGRQHKTHPPIIELAQKIDRTPSAVAMKLCNFTYLDPTENGKGLSGASKTDQEIWEEFQGNLESLADESEPILNPDLSTPIGSTEVKKMVKQRRHQSFFRKAVLGSYSHRCCVTGNPVTILLRASHIIPWSKSEEHRLNPRNGLCLSATYDAAFDAGLISFDQNLRMLVSEELRDYLPNPEIANSFLTHEGHSLEVPEKNLPNQEFLHYHRDKIFKS